MATTTKAPKGFSSRQRIARYLAAHGGVVENPSGRTAGVVRRGCGYTGQITAFSTLLKVMEGDGEVDRKVNKTSCYQIALTEAGYSRYRKILALPDPATAPEDRPLVVIDLDVDVPAAEPAPPEPEPAPVAETSPNRHTNGNGHVHNDHAHVHNGKATATVAEAPPAPIDGIDYDRLVVSVRNLLASEATWLEARRDQDRAEIDELKVRLKDALDEGKKQRARAITFETQLRELERKNTDLRREKTRERQDRVHVTELNEMLNVARKAGWDVKKTNNGHWQLTTPSGRPIIAPSTPSDHRSLLNVRADLRRAGLRV